MYNRRKTQALETGKVAERVSNRIPLSNLVRTRMEVRLEFLKCCFRFTGERGACLGFRLVAALISTTFWNDRALKMIHRPKFWRTFGTPFSS